MTDSDKVLDAEKQEVALEEGTELTRDRRTFLPRTDIYETADGLTILMDIPGAKETDIDILLEKNVLTVHALVEPEFPQGYALALQEYEVGDYQRSFRLSNEINQDKIEASYSHGVLRLNLPKAEAAKAKKISVKVE
ncbi:MAG: Hsp20/alpha crystallin family protein [Chloroflexota bacterium]|jgi:HSP20 family molecular chaperone IbpA